MKKTEIEKQLEALETPPFDQIRHQNALKLPILNASRTAAAGFWLVALPAFFLGCVVMKYYFHVNLGFFDTLEDTLADLDRDSFWFWVSPLLLVVAPLVAFVANALAVLHAAFDQSRNELVITVKLRFWNLFLAVVGLGIVAVFCLYLIVENAGHR